MTQQETRVTAGMIVIGDEILSGRTKDVNIGAVADFCTDLGIDLSEVRIVSDEQDAIVEAVNALRARYTYVFTSGGIGPTHDDITADAIAKAFGVALPINAQARAMLEARWKQTGTEVNEARLRMARIPEGADLIVNSVSAAPGFRIGNVHVMAGVPVIMRAMLEALAPTLKGGKKVSSITVKAAVGEGTVGGPLGALQAERQDGFLSANGQGPGDDRAGTALV
jgi:molybdenum cofactor synthesis domain-containing protein